MSKTRQIFILGAPRSGTTFLASLLDQTYFGKPFETHFITKYHKVLATYGAINEKVNFRKLLTDILNERPIKQWKLNLDITKFYGELEGDYSFSNIVDSLCLKRNKQFGLDAWGDKTPHYIGDFEIIYSLFPNAKFIFIVRDGRDVALSLLEKKWGPNNVYSCAEYWKSLNRDREDFEVLEKNGQLIRLSYEGLLDDTENNVVKIYEFLSQDYSQPGIKKMCSTVKQGNYNKWKKELSANQIKIFDFVAADTLNRFGYETLNSPQTLNPISKLIYRLHNKVVWFKFMFDSNIIDGIKIRFLGKEPFAE
jgi:hypothetical protein